MTRTLSEEAKHRPKDVADSHLHGIGLESFCDLDHLSIFTARYSPDADVEQC